MAYTKYSLTPANNTAAPPDGAPEGMLPSAVNDTMRDMMAQIRDCGDGVRDGTYTMTTPKITGGTITGVTLTGNTFSSPVISGGTINSATVGATTASTGAFTTLTSNGATTFTAGTASTSTTTGTTVITGGLGVSGRINAANFDGIVGANTAAAGSFTTINASTSITNAGLTSGRVTYAGASGLLSDSANLQFNGTNLGVGATPSAWNAVFRVLNLHDSFNIYGQTNDPASGGLTANSYYGTSSFLYKSNGFATHYTQTDGTHKWFTAPSGTAGNAVTFTEAMRITNAGNVGIGTSSPNQKLTLGSSDGTQALSFVTSTYLGDGALIGNIEFSTNNADFDYGNLANIKAYKTGTNTNSGDLTFWTKGSAVSSERVRITNAGNVGIGTSNPAFLTEIVGGATTVETTLFQIRSDASGIGTGSTIAMGNSTSTTAGSGRVELAAIRTTSSGASFVIRTGDNSGTIQERMRIDSSGNLLVGTTTANNNDSTSFVWNVGNGNQFNNHISGTAGGTGYIQFALAGTVIGSITQSGTTAVLYNTTSDYRLKEDVKPMTDALAKVAQLKPVTYKWKADGSDGQGFIAHELQAVVPECVSGEKDAVDANGKPVYQGIDTSFLVATLTAAIQELKAEFDAYKATHP